MLPVEDACDLGVGVVDGQRADQFDGVLVSADLGGLAPDRHGQLADRAAFPPQQQVSSALGVVAVDGDLADAAAERAAILALGDNLEQVWTAPTTTDNCAVKCPATSGRCSSPATMKDGSPGRLLPRQPRQRIAGNTRPQAHQPGTGAVREGSAQLQGLASRGICGRRLAVFYDGPAKSTLGLRALEETCRCRRGYFVEGLGAAHFALPGAVNRCGRCVTR